MKVCDEIMMRKGDHKNMKRFASRMKPRREQWWGPMSTQSMLRNGLCRASSPQDVASSSIIRMSMLRSVHFPTGAGWFLAETLLAISLPVLGQFGAISFPVWTSCFLTGTSWRQLLLSFQLNIFTGGVAVVQFMLAVFFSSTLLLIKKSAAGI